MLSPSWGLDSPCYTGDSPTELANGVTCRDNLTGPGTLQSGAKMSQTFPQIHEPCADWAASYREAQEPRSSRMEESKYVVPLSPNRLKRPATRWEWLGKAYWHSFYRVMDHGGKIDRFPIKELEAKWQGQGGQCAWDDCTLIADRLDHIIPVRIGGAHTLSNIQFLCAEHNSLKAARVYF